MRVAQPLGNPWLRRNALGRVYLGEPTWLSWMRLCKEAETPAPGPERQRLVPMGVRSLRWRVSVYGRLRGECVHGCTRVCERDVLLLPVRYRSLRPQAHLPPPHPPLERADC